MNVLIHKVFPKVYDLRCEDYNLRIFYSIKDLYSIDVEIDSLELINIFRKLGRKIFNSLFNNNISILMLGNKLDVTDYNNEIFKNYHLYKDDICKFIEKNGLPFFSQKQIEEYEECIISQDGFIDFKILNPLITSAITIFLLEALRTGTDKGRLPKIHKLLNTKNNDNVDKHLNDLFLKYGMHENNDLITITYISQKDVSYKRKIISLLNGVWNEYYSLIYSDFSSVNTCIYCGEYTTKNEVCEFKDIHKNCLEEIRTKLISELDKKLLKETSQSKIKDLEHHKKQYQKYDIDVYQRFKKRSYDKKYYDKKKI